MYLNYKTFSVCIDEETFTFKAFRAEKYDSQEKCFIDNGKFDFTANDGRKLSFSDFSEKSFSNSLGRDSATMDFCLSGGPADVPNIQIVFTLNSHAFSIKSVGRCVTEISGSFYHGEDMLNRTFSVETDAQTSILQGTCGPAVSGSDNALFDTLTDTLLYYYGGKMRVDFDYGKNCYSFVYTNSQFDVRDLKIEFKNNYLAEKFNVNYTPVNRNHQFPEPPVGWMTWYAVKFACCADKVLENAEKFTSIFQKYAKKTVIWVDWEWCHNSLEGTGEEGADIFTPRRSAYPDGLAVIAEKIRAMGAIPALWIAPTNEGVLNPMLQEHPEWLLGKKNAWCGQYWVDLSNPEVQEQYVAKIFQQIIDWGYEVVKWDCLPMTLYMMNHFHDKFHDKNMSPHQAFRNTVKTARKVLGENKYLLSCSGSAQNDILFAMDCFDAGRIGGDIFTWEEFIDQAIDRTLYYYPLHNAAFYADADNIVLRSEFNNIAQARSRVSFYGLSGLPITLGDEISALDNDRIEMLKRIMPATVVRPAVLKSNQCGTNYQIINTAVSRSFGKWNVAGITNLGAEKISVKIDFAADLHLDSSVEYAVYDYWNKKFIGICCDRMEVEIAPFDTVVLRLTPIKNGETQIISVNRHILQGAVELEEVKYENNTISGIANCVEGEDLIITLLKADGTVEELTVSGNGRTAF